MVTAALLNLKISFIAIITSVVVEVLLCVPTLFKTKHLKVSIS